MVANWFFEQHLRPFMETLAHFAGKVFDDDDWIGLEYDLLLRDQPPGAERRIEWPLGDRVVHLTYEPGTSVVSFQIEADHDFELRADTLTYVMQR